MLELSTQKKHKVSLADYPYQRDLKQRDTLSRLSSVDFAVLEEILFSSLRIPLEELLSRVDCDEKTLFLSLEKFQKIDLLSFDSEHVIIDKEVRKQIEALALRFDSDFTPDMEYLQQILKKVPIHILPTWYAIPRTSNNIFESIVEKYLGTPHLYKRYLSDLNIDPVLSAMTQDVFESDSFFLSEETLKKKYGLSDERFGEATLLLEFHFLLCLSYQKTKNGWEAGLTPFHEWKEYLAFLKTTNPKPILKEANLEKTRPFAESFIQDMTAALTLIRREPFSLNQKGYEQLQEKLGDPESLTSSYIDRVLKKLMKLNLVESGKKISITQSGIEWLEMRVESRPLYLYRHPLNRLQPVGFADAHAMEKLIRDAEKALHRIAYHGWIRFKEFMASLHSPLGEKSGVQLKKNGKHWSYAIPEYSKEDEELFHTLIFEHLFETGMTATGLLNQEEECFTLTPLGQSLFGQE